MRELWAEHPSHPLWSLMTSSVAKQVLKSSCEGTECTVFLQIIKVFNPRCLNISDAACIHIWNTKYHTRMLLFLLMSCLKKGCKEHVLMIKATINGWSQGCLKVSCFLLKKIVIKAKVIVGICGFSFSSVIFTFVIHWPSPICLISKMGFITLTFSFYTLELKVYVSGKLFFFFGQIFIWISLTNKLAPLGIHFNSWRVGYCGVLWVLARSLVICVWVWVRSFDHCLD